MHDLTLEWFKARVGTRTSETSPSPFGRWLDGTLRVADEGHFVVDYAVREEMTNPAGIVHGGAVSGMFDDVFGMLAASASGRRHFVTVNLHVDFLESARAGDLVTVDCRIVRRGATVINAEASLAAGDRLLARATTNMVMRRQATAEERRAASATRSVGSGLEFETERLRLAPLGRDSVDAIHEVWVDPHVRRFLWDDEVIPRERAVEIVEANLASFGASRRGLWGVHLGDGGQLIGFCGFWHFHDPPRLELVYGLGPGHLGRGYATEAARAALAYAFERLGMERVEASTDAANAASVAVLERLGMAFSRRESANGLDTVHYSLERPAWLERQVRRPL